MSYLADFWKTINVEYLLSLLFRVVAVLICLTIHESAHGVAAFLLGDKTAQKQHRISLNPLHHIDWFGLLALFLCGFGWAKPVRVDPRSFRHPKVGMALTAFAGPLSNFLLALLLMPVMIYCLSRPQLNWLFLLSYQCSYMSIGLGIFNLIPFPPLDGSKVLAMFLPDRFYNILMRFERIGILILLVIMQFGFGDFQLSLVIDKAYWFLLNLFL